MKILILILCLAITGCGTVHERMSRLKDRNQNTVMVTFKGNVQDAKMAVRRVGFELSLIEPKGVETEDFLELRTNMLKDSAMVAFFGAIGSLTSGQTKLGFIFEYDNLKDITNIIIAEEGGNRRDSIADKLKIISLKSVALAKQ